MDDSRGLVCRISRRDQTALLPLNTPFGDRTRLPVVHAASKLEIQEEEHAARTAARTTPSPCQLVWHQLDWHQQVETKDVRAL